MKTAYVFVLVLLAGLILFAGLMTFLNSGDPFLLVQGVFNAMLAVGALLKYGEK